MYCRNCGNEVSDKAIMCVACGVPPKAESKYCYNCKAETTPYATICMKCGVGLKNEYHPVHAEGREWLTTLLLCFFVGVFGVHRFYTKHTLIGVVQLLTLGGCGVWILVDLILILTGSFRDGDGYKLVNNLFD